MEPMKGRKEEAELIARLDLLTGECHITVISWPAMDRKMRRLYGMPLPKSGDSVDYWTVPLKALSFRRLESLSKAQDMGTLPSKRRAGGQFERKLEG
jgi:hypothetical protein